MTTQAEYHGGAIHRALGANADLHLDGFALTQVDATAAALTFDLTPKTDLRLDNKWVVQNRGGTNSFTLRDPDDLSTVETLAVGELTGLSLSEKADGTREWSSRKKSFDAAQDATPAQVVYVIGGGISSSVDDAVQEYNQQSAAWTTRTDKPTGCRSGCGFVLGAIGVVAGDIDTADDEVVEKYNPDVWTGSLGATGFACRAGQSDQADGKGLVCGTIADTDICQEYDLSGDSWTGKTDKTNGTTDGTAETESGLVYVIDGGNPPTNRLERFDRVGNAWTSRASSPTLFSKISSFLSGDRIYKLCGETGGTEQDAVEEYNPVGNSWVTRTDFPGGDRSLAGGGDAEGSGYLCGGTTPLKDDHWVYNEVADTWTQLDDMPTGKNNTTEQVLDIAPP